MTQWAEQVGELPTILLAGVLGVVMVLDAVPLLGVLVPGDVAVLAAVGVGRPATGAVTVAAVVAGCLAGWSLSFLAGRRYGDRLRRSRVGGWIGEPRWAAAEDVLRAGGGRMVLVAPFLPVLNALVPLAAGGLRMSYARFLACAGAGAALWAGLYVALGTVSRSLAGLLPGRPSPMLVTLAVGLLLAGAVLLGARRRLRAAVDPAPAVRGPNGHPARPLRFAPPRGGANRRRLTSPGPATGAARGAPRRGCCPGRARGRTRCRPAAGRTAGAPRRR
jgi:membrane protein DedA with SNARE-associated domain